MNEHSGNKQPVELSAESPLRFACHAGLPCYTQCCRDVNIYLTPYDVLRLRRATKLSSRAFLDRYTRHFLAKVTHIPVVQLAMNPDTLYCPFVTEDGCRVYEDRPWACRMFPLDLAGPPGRYRLIRGNDRCLGLLEKDAWTVGRWLESQGIGPYTRMEEEFQGVMPAGFEPGQRLDAGLGKILFLAYDLDRFARMVVDRRFRSFYGVDDEVLNRLQEDDEALLRLAFRYIRSQMEELIRLV
ncbi:MAG: YkgJ family cysteine cluster protein [Thermodesulfobacteriota bacterium]|nr:YkgJ family cysteine cluster protein [Thermodesulfobacteriota bacterium]